MNNDIRAVIFDLDDTLYDRNAAQAVVARLFAEKFPDIFANLPSNEVLAAFLESDRLVTIDFYGGAPSEGLRDKRNRVFLKLLGRDEEMAKPITEAYIQEYPHINTPVPGAVSVVQKITGKMPAAVVTNGLPDAQYSKIRAIGLEGCFACTVLSEELGIRKPDVRIFQHAAGLLEVKAENCLFVGDNYQADVLGAKAAGMRACWFNPDGNAPEDGNPGPDYVISRLEELLEVPGISGESGNG